jgi:Ca-activated chloride channel family protein
MTRLADPLILLLFLILIPAAFLHGESGARIRFSSVAGLKRLNAGRRFNPRRILLVLRLVALGLMILALARPQAGRTFSEAQSDGVDILLAIDTSGSMQALDFKIDDRPVDRLTVVKNVVTEFIRQRPNDRIGLVVFGEEAFTQCPLTLDHGILLDFLKGAEIGMAGDATAIGSALGTTVNRLKDLKAKERVVILLTDGRSNAGRITPLNAAQLAATYHVKVYTVGVGTKGKAPFLVNTVFGPRYQYEDVDIDEETLREISQRTGGAYFRATDTEGLKEIYAKIDKLERFEVKVKEYTEYSEKFHWALIPGLGLLLIEFLLAQTRLRKIP